MKKLVTLVGVVCLLVSAGYAQQPSFGVGASGGLHIPVVQDDQESGTIFEIRGRIAGLAGFVIEPKISFSKYGEPEHDEFDFGIDGSKITAYGVDVLLGGGPGIKGASPFLVGGVGFYKTSNDDTELALESETKIGFSFGAGLAFGLSPQFALDLRGKAHVISSEGSTSKKSLAVYGGLNFNFGVK